MKDDTWYEIWASWEDGCYSPALFPESSYQVRDIIRDLEDGMMECQFWAPSWKAAKGVFEKVRWVLHELGPQ